MVKVILFLILSEAAFCQGSYKDQDTVQYTRNGFSENQVLKLMFPYPSIKLGGQFNLFNSITVDGSIGYDVLLTNGTFYPHIVYEPLFEIKGKYYYGMKRRMNKSKNIKGFSGNYFLLNWDHTLIDWDLIPNNFISTNPGITIQTFSSVGFGWGLQRTFGRKKLWFVDFGIIYGISYFRGVYKLHDHPLPRLDFGYMLR